MSIRPNVDEEIVNRVDELLKQQAGHSDDTLGVLGFGDKVSILCDMVDAEQSESD